MIKFPANNETEKWDYIQREINKLNLMSDLNQKIDQAQAEAAAIKSEGVKQYIWSKKVSLSIAALLIVVAISFVAGAIIF